MLFFSCSVMSNSLQPHGLEHARLPYLSPSPRACSNSCPLSRWCHRTISSSITHFSSCLQSFSASVQFSAVTQSCPTLRPHRPQHTRPPCPSPTPEFTKTHVHWAGDAIQLSDSLCPLLLLPAVFPSIRVFSIESALHIRWPKYWSFSFNISPSSEHPGLISFRMAWLDLLAVQGTLKSLLQYHSSKHHFFSTQPSL